MRTIRRPRALKCPPLRLLVLVVVAVAAVAAAWPSARADARRSLPPADQASSPSVPLAEEDDVDAASVSVPPARQRRDNPDPYVIASDGEYLAYFTQGRSNVPLRVSTDWTTWSKPTDVLPELPAWARPGRTWAPAVAERDGRWVLYFTAWHASSGLQCIGTGTAITPYGPFEPSPQPIVCQLELGGSIDPSPFADATGSYLLWKSDENALDRPARLWAAPVDRTGTALGGGPVALLTADHGWEEPLIENPAMVVGDDGRRWLFYSAGAWDTVRYSTGLATCDGPLGPCRKLAHDEPWLGSVGDMVGPGGLDTFRTPDGEVMAGLHAWEPDAVGYDAGGQRTVRIGHLDLTGPLPTFEPHLD